MRIALSKIVEQGSAPADRVAGKGNHLCQRSKRFGPLSVVRHGINKEAHFGDVALGKEQGALRGLTIATRPAGLLVVVLNAFRQVGMNNIADVGFINPHAEGYGGNNNVHFIADKGLLVAFAIGVAEACMVGQRPEPF